ncbi:hypothetical protein GQ600_14156 [Phytophthora cactorum]|nr:hypothetical protein GQ600_14156 [Phytophthora cactorum]
MRSIWITAIAVSLAVAVGGAENTKFCAQDEKQRANKLHEQNTEPAKSCYRAANGDITTLDTSRLCPLPECVTWLNYMVANAPDCYFDSKNYATIYAAKSADCTIRVQVCVQLEREREFCEFEYWDRIKQRYQQRSSSMEEDRDLNTTSSLSNSIGGSAVDEMSSVGRSDVDADSTSSYVEADVPTAASPTPTEDLSNEDAVKACIKPRRTRAMVLTMEELARAAQLGGKHIMEEVSWRELMDMSYEAGGVYPTIMGYALGAIAVLFFSRCSTWSLQWLLLVAAGTGVCCTYVQLASLDLVHEHFVSKKVVIKFNKRKKHD